MRTPFSALPGIVVVLLALGCGGDGPTGPRRLAGYYQLESVAGQNLPVTLPPPCPFCPPVTTHHGDLVLRADGTYDLGVGGSGFQSGTFRVGGNTVNFTVPATPEWPEGISMSGTAGGDSIVVLSGVNGSIPLTFRRATRPSVAISPGMHVLASINGAGPPLITYESTIDGDRFVSSVVFDSIAFESDVFYRRHRSEQATRYDADGQVVSASSASYMHYGSYIDAPGRVILRPFVLAPSGAVSDTLAIIGSALVRSSTMGTTTLEERYERP